MSSTQRRINFARKVASLHKFDMFDMLDIVMSQFNLCGHVLYLLHDGSLGFMKLQRLAMLLRR
jgi:hypothetical protein